MNTKKKIWLFNFLLCCMLLKAQDIVYSGRNFGFNVGANFAIGSHFQRFGLNLNFFYVNNFFQTNSEARAYFSYRNLGPKLIYHELVLAQGVVFGYGPKQTYFNPFLSNVSNQTGFANAVAYSYNAYFNKIKTTQQTGIIALQFDPVTVVLENDIFARQILDRYRTGAFLVQYQYRDIYQAGINCTMWTGWMGKPVRGDSCFAAGYIDTTGATYASYSHGLLSGQFRYHAGLSQIVQANIGIDAEQVRNVMQNRVIHDMCWLPKSWFKRYNCHIPMVDENSCQYLYRPGQKVRKPRFYWNIFSNPNLFY